MSELTDAPARRETLPFPDPPPRLTPDQFFAGRPDDHEVYARTRALVLQSVPMVTRWTTQITVLVQDAETNALRPLPATNVEQVSRLTNVVAYQVDWEARGTIQPDVSAPLARLANLSQELPMDVTEPNFVWPARGGMHFCCVIRSKYNKTPTTRSKYTPRPLLESAAQTGKLFLQSLISHPKVLTESLHVSADTELDLRMASKRPREDAEEGSLQSDHSTGGAVFGQNSSPDPALDPPAAKMSKLESDT